MLDKKLNKWGFDKKSTNLKMFTFGTESPNMLNTNYLSFDNVPHIFNGICNFYGYNGIYLLAINPIDFSVRPVYDGDRYQICNSFSSPFVTRFVEFSKNPPMFNRLDSTLRTLIKEGEIVAMMTIGNAEFSSWPAYLKNTFKNLYGSTKIDSLKDNEPYILVSRKGVGMIAEKYSSLDNPRFGTLNLDTAIYNLGNEGYINSPIIGPATEW